MYSTVGRITVIFVWAPKRQKPRWLRAFDYYRLRLVSIYKVQLPTAKQFDILVNISKQVRISV